MGDDVKAQTSEARKRLRQEAFDLNECTNGPDEDGTYPCDPQVILGGGWAQCQVCGREGKWSSTQAPAKSGAAQEGFAVTGGAGRQGEARGCPCPHCPSPSDCPGDERIAELKRALAELRGRAEWCAMHGMEALPLASIVSVIDAALSDSGEQK
jgi:hypothetical protein